MKWLHFSDLHRIIDQIQGESALILDMLPEYLTEQKITADYLFFTGDFRYAKTQTAFSDNEVAEKVAHTIKKIASIVGVTDENYIHITAGNHDLKPAESPVRAHCINSLNNKYIKNLMTKNVEKAFIENETMIELTKPFVFFKEVLFKLYSKERASDLWDKFKNQGHYMNTPPKSDVGILCLNTALLTNGKSAEESGRLLLGHTHVRTVIAEHYNNPDTKNKPIIALAHHSLDDLHPSEKKQLRLYFDNYNVRVYLFGHRHEIRSSVTDGILLEASAGSFRKERNDEIGFLRGEYNPKTKHFTILGSHIWTTNGWDKGPIFFKGKGNRIEFSEGDQQTYKANLSSEKLYNDLQIPLSMIESEATNLDTHMEKGELIEFLKTRPREQAVNFLISGPSESNNLDRNLTTKLFYDNFYIKDNDNENDLKRKLADFFNDPEHNMFLLQGDAGTGKSTFIRTMALKAWDNLATNPLYYRYFILDCAERPHSKELALDPFPNAALFTKTKNEYSNMIRAANNGAKIWKESYMELLLAISENQKSFESFETSGLTRQANKIHSLLSQDNYRPSYDTREIFNDSFGNSINMFLYCLLLASKNTLFDSTAQRKYVIVYDNVEAYTASEHLKVGRVFKSINEELFDLFDKIERLNLRPQSMEPINFIKDFTFIISLRPTTQLDPESFSSIHDKNNIFGENSKFVFNRKFYDFTLDALLRKLKFLKEHCYYSDIFKECRKIVALIIPYNIIESYLNNGSFNEDIDLKKYISQKYMPFFNNNYRNAIASLNYLYNRKVSENETWMSNVLNLSTRNQNELDNVRINAARHIILRSSLDKFNHEQYLTQMNIHNITGEQSYSLTRLLMTFIRSCEKKQLSNKCYGPHGLAIHEITNFMSPLFKINDVLVAIFRLSKWTSSESLGKIVDSRIRSEMISKWAYFLDINCSQSHYEKLLNGSLSINESNVFVKLTHAGKCFIDYISLQFEYFATRFDRNSPPDPLSLCVINSNLLNKAANQAEAVFIAVENFALGIANTKELESIKNKNMLEEHVIIRSAELSSMITEHIDYIDRCRILALSQQYSEADKKTLNKRLLFVIGQYLKLMNRGAETFSKYSSNIKCEYHGAKAPISLEEIKEVLSELSESLDPNKLVYSFFEKKNQSS